MIKLIFNFFIMFGLQIKMWLLVVVMFGILYGIILGLGTYFGIGNTWIFIGIGVLLTGIQYWVGPLLISKIMRIKYVSEKEEPELHQIVEEMAQKANISKPRIGIAQLSIPNAFAFGRSIKDGRVGITQGLKSLLNKNELKAVIGHEIAHIKHRDMMIMTLLSVVPLVLYWVAWSTIWNSDNKNAVLIGIGAFILYFLSNFLVLYGSRIREYYADERSVRLGNAPHYLASALYKLVYSSVQIKKTRIGQMELKRVSAVKAFFMNDVNSAWSEVRNLKEVDRDFSGTIDQDELLALKTKDVKITKLEKLMEIFTTHPNTLKRIKRLSDLG